MSWQIRLQSIEFILRPKGLVISNGCASYKLVSHWLINNLKWNGFVHVLNRVRLKQIVVPVN